MIIKNKETKKDYPITKENWDELGKHQKLFIIVENSDENIEKVILMDNVLPSNGNKIVSENKIVQINKTNKK